MLSALGISSSTHDAAGIGTSSPAAKVGAVISQAIAGSRAYQRLSAAPSRTASQPPAKTPAVPPTRSSDPLNWPVGMRANNRQNVGKDKSVTVTVNTGGRRRIKKK